MAASGANLGVLNSNKLKSSDDQVVQSSDKSRTVSTTGGHKSNDDNIPRSNESDGGLSDVSLSSIDAAGRYSLLNNLSSNELISVPKTTTEQTSGSKVGFANVPKSDDEISVGPKTHSSNLNLLPYNPVYA
eukprot:641223_1